MFFETFQLSNWNLFISVRLDCLHKHTLTHTHEFAGFVSFVLFCIVRLPFLSLSVGRWVINTQSVNFSLNKKEKQKSFIPNEKVLLHFVSELATFGKSAASPQERLSIEYQIASHTMQFFLCWASRTGKKMNWNMNVVDVDFDLNSLAFHCVWNEG